MFRWLTALFFCAVLFAPPAVTAQKKQPPAEPVDLNAATVKELEELPGVGPTTANAIIQFRTQTGKFRRVNDLLAIRGISEAKLKKIRPYVTIGPPPPKTPASSTPSTHRSSANETVPHAPPANH